MDGNKKRTNILTKIKTQYRIVFINDQSLQEVASFKLSMRRLYVLFSTIFVLIVTMTVCILLLTPLKYYIPGYGNNPNGMRILKMRRSMDSLADLVSAQQMYEANLQKVINGDYNGRKDTTRLNLNEVRKEQMNIIPQPTELRKEAVKQLQTTNKGNAGSTSND